MKKIFSLMMASALTLAFVACSSEEDDIFDHSAAERLNSVSADYSAKLCDSKGGWIMEYYPYSDNEDMLTGTGYLIVNRFNSDGSVYTAMKNKATYELAASTGKITRGMLWEDVSAWEVITDMGPVLTYNTYNKCYGRFSDPTDIDLTAGRYDDESGKGFQGDYEFIMVDLPEDGQHIMLKGKKRSIYQRMTRLPEGTDAETYLDDIEAFNKNMFFAGAKWELNMMDHGTRYKMNYTSTMRPTIYPAGRDSVSYGWHMPFLVTKHADRYCLRFKDSVMVNGTQMEQEFVYNSADDKFHGVVDANNTIEGGYPTEFFSTIIKKGGSRWTWNADSEMSDEFKTLYNQIAGEFKSILTCPLQGMDLRVNGSTLFFCLQYKDGKNTMLVNFVCELEEKDNHVSIKYVKDDTVYDGNARQLMPSIQTMIDLLQTSWKVSETTTRFNLSTLKLTQTDNSNMWFVVNLK